MKFSWQLQKRTFEGEFQGTPCIGMKILYSIRWIQDFDTEMRKQEEEEEQGSK
jgi:hypothetical protein